MTSARLQPLLAVAILAGCATYHTPADHSSTGASPVAPRRVGAGAFDTDGGGPLPPEQAAYDVRGYQLALTIDPETRTIEGTGITAALVLEPLDIFLLDLDRRMSVSGVDVLHVPARLATRGDGPPPGTAGAAHDTLAVRGAFVHEDLPFTHEGGRLYVHLPEPLAPGDRVRVTVRYAGAPRVAPTPPWDGGFTWSESRDGTPWIGVSCQVDGADLWWPCKDHPSDEPDDGVLLAFTVPDTLEAISNGVLESVRAAPREGWHTYWWRSGHPINTYGVTVNVGRFRALEGAYEQVTGGTMPVTFWALPEDTSAAREVLDRITTYARFLEETYGPYPWADEKLGVIQAPYVGMEHQTIITVGELSDPNPFGFHRLALHELTHEWWGNRATASDWRDFWIHEGIDFYTEALAAGWLNGEATYHEYIARFCRPGVSNRYEAAPREAVSIRQMLYPDGYDPSQPNATLRQMDVNLATKSSVALHSLRWLIGDDAFFGVLRETIARGGFTSTVDFATRCEIAFGRSLSWFFDLYFHQPALPRLVVDEIGVGVGATVELRWETPDRLAFPMPIEVWEWPEGIEPFSPWTRAAAPVTGAGGVGDVEPVRRRIAMPGGRARFTRTTAGALELDPDHRVLRETAPDPDRFGRVGVGG